MSRRVPTTCNICGRSDTRFYPSNPSTCAECVIRRRMERYVERRDDERAAMSEYGKRTRAIRSDREQRWRVDNPERAAAARRRRKLRRRAREASAFVEDVDPQVVYERDEGVCGVCGEPVDLADFHVDHVIPLARGGEHSYANTQVAHPLCNMRKGAKAA